MTTRELRIGNYVMVGCCFVRVNGITQRKIGYSTNPCRERYARSYEVMPVPLIGEILEKISIRESDGNQFFIDDDTYVTFDDKGVCRMFCNGKFYDVDTIHMLQNIYFFIKKKELKVIL